MFVPSGKPLLAGADFASGAGEARVWGWDEPFLPQEPHSSHSFNVWTEVDTPLLWAGGVSG